MKFTFGQLISLALALVFAALLIYEVPFQAAAAATADASAQVVYAPVFEPPVIGSTAGKIDIPLLMLELAFVAFVGGAIFFATSRKKKGD